MSVTYAFFKQTPFEETISIVSVCNLTNILAGISLRAHANAPLSALVKIFLKTQEACGPQYHFHQGILCYYP